jgi:hypothetical protein
MEINQGYTTMHGQPTIKNGTLPLAKKAQNFFMTAVKE